MIPSPAARAEESSLKAGIRRLFVSCGLGLLLLVMAVARATAAPAAAAPADDASPARLLERAARARWASRFTESDSVARVARVALEAAARPDTALLARAWFEVACSWRMRRITTSDDGLTAARMCLKLFAATPDAPDSLLYLAHDAAGWFSCVFGRSPEGARHFRAAADLARRAPAAWGARRLTSSLYLLGWACTNYGASDSALVALNEALRLREALHDPKDTLPGDIHAFIGVAAEQKGEMEQAAAAYAAAIAHTERVAGPDSPELRGPLSRAAAFEFRRGDFARAIDYYQRTLDGLLARSPDDPEVDLFRIAVGQVLEQLGDARRAVDIFADALPRYESRVGVSNVQAIQAWVSYGSACQKLGRNSQALEIFDRLRRRLEADSARADKLMLVVALGNEAQLLSLATPSDSALHLAERAVALNRAPPAGSPAQELSGLCVQLLVHARRGRRAEAERVDAELTRVLAAFPSGGNIETDPVWVARSQAATLQGRRAAAVAAAAEGARQARERLATNVRALSDRQALLLSSTLSPALDQLLKAGARLDSASLALCWDEVTRTRGLVRDEISRRRLPAGLAVDSTLVAAHHAWVRAERQLARFQVDAAGAPTDAATDSSRAALRAAVDETERRLVGARPGARAAGPPADLAAVRARLTAGQALVSFVRAPGEDDAPHLLAFVARGGDARLTSLDLGAVAELAPLVARWKAALGELRPARRNEAACRALGADVRRRAWDPIARAVGDARDIYLVPEAPLDGLPWGALPAARGRYLVEEGPLIHTLDAERELLTDPGATPAGGLLAVGDVDFDRADAPAETPGLIPATPEPVFRGVPAPCDSLAGRAFPPLPATGAELGDVLAAWARGPEAAEPALPLRGGGATEAAVKRECSGRRVLHLATHGVALSDTCAAPPRGGRGQRGVGGVAPLSATGAAGEAGDTGRRPRRPAGRAARRPAAAASDRAVDDRPSPWLGREVMLVLAGANRARDGGHDENEGLLTAEEVTTLDLRGTEWVVLSACHSAAGEAWAGQGVLGLGRAFHLAGARSVIASQWSVEDEATRRWMRALYDARAGGAATAAAAVSQACRATLAARRIAHLSTHPFYWAAFTASGE